MNSNNRSITTNYIKSKEDIIEIAKNLLDSMWPCEPIKLLRLKLSNLLDEKEFHEKNEKMKLITEFTKVIDKDELNKKHQENLKEFTTEECSKKREKTKDKKLKSTVVITLLTSSLCFDQFCSCH